MTVSSDAAPALSTAKASALVISGLPGGFSTCCLRFTSDVANSRKPTFLLQSVAGFDRNRWPTSVGIGGRLPTSRRWARSSASHRAGVIRPEAVALRTAQVPLQNRCCLNCSTLTYVPSRGSGQVTRANRVGWPRCPVRRARSGRTRHCGFAAAPATRLRMLGGLGRGAPRVATSKRGVG
jgi:hypothetical protein